jgi:cell shape-determining protein MreC
MDTEKSIQENVNKRNVDALHQAVKDDRKKLEKFIVEFENYKKTNIQLRNELEALRQQMVTMFSMR